MRQYTIYWMEDEFLYHYFGRESMFYQLFTEQQAATHELKNIINKQINYITKKIPVFSLHTFLQTELKDRTDYRLTNDGHFIDMMQYRSKACLHIENDSLTLTGIGMYEAEMVFFDILRKWDMSSLAINFQDKRFGWVSPIKQRKFV